MKSNRQQILAELEPLKAEIATRFGVRRLSLFGSAARDSLDSASDVDFLVEFEGSAKFANYMDLKFFLEDLLGRSVDLVTDKALRRELRPFVEEELIRVA